MAGQCLAWHTRAKAPGKPQSALFTTRYGNPRRVIWKTRLWPAERPSAQGWRSAGLPDPGCPWVAAQCGHAAGL